MRRSAPSQPAPRTSRSAAAPIALPTRQASTGHHQSPYAARPLCTVALPSSLRPLARVVSPRAMGSRPCSRVLRAAPSNRSFSTEPAPTTPTPDPARLRELLRAREGVTQLPPDWQNWMRNTMPRAGDAQKAIEDLNAAQEALGLPPAVVFKELGHRIAKLPGAVQGMMELHRQLSEFKIPAADHGSIPVWLMIKLFEERKFAEAMQVFHEARKYATLDAHAYELALQMLARQNEAETMFRLFEEMRNTGVQPTERHYAPLLAVSTKDRERFYALRNEARSFGFRLGLCWDIVVTALLRFGDVAAALETYRAMRPEARRFDGVLLNKLLFGLRRENNPAAMVEVYNIERNLGNYISPLLTIHVLWALSVLGEPKKAIKVFDICCKETKERGAPVTARSRSAELALFRQILDICARYRDIEHALHYYELALQEGFHTRQLPQFLSSLLGPTPTDAEIELVFTRLIAAADRADEKGFSGTNDVEPATPAEDDGADGDATPALELEPNHNPARPLPAAAPIPQA